MANLKKHFLKSFGKNIFIEAGTHKGDSVMVAIDSGFKKVYSCEPAINRYDFCRERFKDEINSGLVVLEPKSSLDFFKQILPDLNEGAVFWLDSHKDDNSKGLESLPPCPIISEIKLISEYGSKGHVLLIDDIRIFGKLGWGKNITVNDIKQELKNIDENCKVYFVDGYTKNDVLVCEF